MSKTAAVFFNTSAHFIGQFVGTIVSLLTFILLARYLGVSTYGEYVIVTTYLGFFAVLADWGLYLLVVKGLSENESEEQQRKVFGKLVAFRITISFFALLLGVLIVLFFPYSATVKAAIGIGAVAYFMTSLTQLINGIFQARLKIYIASLIDILYRSLVLVGVFVVSLLGLRLLGVMAVTVITSTLMVLLGLYLSRKQLAYKLSDIKFSKDFWLDTFRSSWALGLASFLGVLLFKIDAIILSFYTTSDIVGIYGMPLKVLEILAALPGAFMGAAFPILAKYFADKDPRMGTSVNRIFSFLLIMAAMVTVIIYSLAEPIVLLVGGSEFLPSVFALQVLIFSLALGFFNNMFFHLAVILNRQVQLIWRTAVALVINIVLNIVFIPLYSFKAAAIITVGTEALSLGLSAYIVYQVFKFNLFSYRILSIGLAAVVAFFSLRYIAAAKIPAPEIFAQLPRTAQAMDILVVALAGFSIFVVTLVLFKGVSREDFRLIFKKS